MEQQAPATPGAAGPGGASAALAEPAASAPAAEAVAQRHDWPVRFVGSGSEYFRIWIVNLLLTLVTLGLYYPFAKIRRLRYFHGATEVDGHPLAFHGDPWKMWRGYLLVGALVGVYSVAGHVSPVAGLVAFVIVAGLWPLLWCSSLRFRLANTGWRGLRFGFAGDVRGAYMALAPSYLPALAILGLQLFDGGEEAQPSVALSMAVLALFAISLLALPALFWLIRRYQQSNLVLGHEHARFHVGPGGFYGVGLRAGGLLLLAGATLAGLAWGLGAGGGAGSGDGSEAAGPATPHWTLVLLPIVLVLLTVVVVVPYANARLQNLVWNGTRSRHLSFRSALRARSVVALSLKNWLLMLCTLGLYLPFAQVAMARLRLHAVTVCCETDPERLVADAARLDESAAGDAAGDLFGLDIGL